MINYVTLKDRLMEMVPLQRCHSDCSEAQPVFRGRRSGYIGTFSRSFFMEYLVEQAMS
jgi:hypothetical protein